MYRKWGIRLYKILLYADARGNCPLANFIAELDRKAPTDKVARNLLKKFYYSVELLKQNGTRCGEMFTKQIDGKLWELRPDDYRVFSLCGMGIILFYYIVSEKHQIRHLILKLRRQSRKWKVGIFVTGNERESPSLLIGGYNKIGTYFYLI